MEGKGLIQSENDAETNENSHTKNLDGNFTIYWFTVITIISDKSSYLLDISLFVLKL